MGRQTGQPEPTATVDSWPTHGHVAQSPNFWLTRKPYSKRLAAQRSVVPRWAVAIEMAKSGLWRSLRSPAFLRRRISLCEVESGRPRCRLLRLENGAALFCCDLALEQAHFYPLAHPCMRPGRCRQGEMTTALSVAESLFWQTAYG